MCQKKNSLSAKEKIPVNKEGHADDLDMKRPITTNSLEKVQLQTMLPTVNSKSVE